MANDFAKIYSMYFFYIISHVFGWTLSTLYFLQNGYSALDISLYMALCFAISALLVTRGGLSGGKSINLGLLMKMAIFLLALGISSRPIFFLIGALWGFMTIYFWVPLNIKFFKLGKEGKNAMHSGLYFIMWPLLGALVPVVSGAAASAYGMKLVFLAGAALLVPALVINSRTKYGEYIPFNFKKFIANTKGVKTLMFLQGIMEGVEWVVVPIATYSFITTEVKYGAFFSYLGIFGLAAFLIMARISDKIKKRAMFLAPVSAALGIFTILSAMAPNLAGWTIYRGLASFFVSIFSPFAITVVVDVSKSMVDSMVSREYFLNTGRALGALIVAGIAFFSQDVKFALIFSGAALLIYPIILLRKRNGYSVRI